MTVELPVDEIAGIDGQNGRDGQFKHKLFEENECTISMILSKKEL
jgi:hypothetical protein